MKCKNMFFLIFFIVITLDLFAVDTIVYPKVSPSDKRYLDVVEILKVSLEKTKNEYGDYVVKPSTSVMNEIRWVSETQNGKKLNIMWGTPDKEKEKNLIPIYIPLRKGILGYRIFLIRKNNQEMFSEINSVDQLKKYTVGQGADWGDVKVFKANKFKVVGGSSYEGLFQMLSTGRFDFFSRGVNEAYPEYEARKNKIKNLHVEESIVLYYPWPYLYFVSPKDSKLAKRIERGLKIMINDGTMDKLFLKYNKETIERSNLKGRKVLRINNPYLSDKLPIKEKKYWFDPYE